ncbi:MAG: amidase family protein [Myxococcota bacterium]|nr:amidase family protein [Myxococcota bacterium]
MASWTRREFLAAGGAGLASACAGFPSFQDEAPGPVGLDALGQAKLVHNREVDPPELVEETIARIEAMDGPINAVTTRFFEKALAIARGPLPGGPFRGVPYLLKDLADFQGTKKTMGSRLFADFVSSENSAHTQASLEAGLVILGKTNTPEFGLVATTESALLGPCRNPWDLSRSSGGSSGGAAAAVAAGMLPMAQATDGGGSIRIPASCCGVFGLKPSRGRNRKSGPPRAVEISVEHVVTRSVRDSAAFLAVTERRDRGAPLPKTGHVEGPSSKRLRIAFHTTNAYGAEPDPEVRAAIEQTAGLCADLGHLVVPASPDYRGGEFLDHFLNLWTSGPLALRRQIESQGRNPEELLEPVTLGMAARFEKQPPDALPRAARFMREYAAAMEAFFANHPYDVLLTPVTARLPVPLGTQGGTLPFEEMFDPMVDYVSYTPFWNATGNPAMSVPLGWSGGGLPIGSQFVAPLGGEGTLLALAYELEEAAPWATRRPPLAPAA